MEKTIKAIWTTKLKAARTISPMTTLFLVLLGIVAVSILIFGLLLFRLSLDDADFWLKVLSGELAVIIFAIGLAALITGYFTNEKLTKQVMQSAAAITVAQLRLSEQQERAANAERALLELQQAREDVESSIVPRDIHPFRLTEFVNTLKPFAGTLVEVGAIDEREPKRLAKTLVRLLKDSGWKVKELPPVKEDVGDGVRVHIAKTGERSPLKDALLSVMNANKIVTRFNPPYPDQPANTIRIVVGLQETLHLLWKRQIEDTRQGNSQ
jgi:hypothetical protein